MGTCEERRGFAAWCNDRRKQSGGGAVPVLLSVVGLLIACAYLFLVPLRLQRGFEVRTAWAVDLQVPSTDVVSGELVFGRATLVPPNDEAALELPPPVEATIEFDDDSTPATVKWGEGERVATFRFRPSRPGDVRLTPRGPRIWGRSIVVAVAAAGVLVAASDPKDVYVRVYAWPDPAPEGETKGTWRTDLKARLVKKSRWMKDRVPEKAVVKHDVTVEFEPPGGASVDRAQVTILAGDDRPRPDAVFTTTHESDNRVDVTPDPLEGDRAVDVRCDSKGFVVVVDAVPDALLSDGRSTASIRCIVIEKPKQWPPSHVDAKPSPVEVTLDLDDTLRPDTIFGTQHLVIPAGGSSAKTTLRSYSIGVDQVSVISQGMISRPRTKNGDTVPVVFLFPWTPLLICVAVAASTSALLSLVKKLQGKDAEWWSVPLSLLNGAFVWFGMRHGIVVLEGLTKVVAPFTEGGSVVMGLAAGLLNAWGPRYFLYVLAGEAVAMAVFKALS
jgi:hypothetical protein